MKKDIITFELSKGSLIAIGTATLAMGAVSVALKFLTGGDLSSSEMQDIFAMIPLVNIGVLSIFYLVAGCLSLQYMRLLMLFGATRTTAFVRYVSRVAVTMIISLIGLLAVYFISGMISDEIDCQESDQRDDRTPGSLFHQWHDLWLSAASREHIHSFLCTFGFPGLFRRMSLLIDNDALQALYFLPGHCGNMHYLASRIRGA